MYIKNVRIEKSSFDGQYFGYLNDQTIFEDLELYLDDSMVNSLQNCEEFNGVEVKSKSIFNFFDDKYGHEFHYSYLLYLMDGVFYERVWLMYEISDDAGDSIALKPYVRKDGLPLSDNEIKNIIKEHMEVSLNSTVDFTF